MKFLLGTAQLSRAYGVVQKKNSEAPGSPVEVVVEAELLGFSGVDTAPVYGDAEADIGRAESNLPVYTKIHPLKSLDESIHKSRAALRRGFLHGVYLHEEYIASQEQQDLLKRMRDRKSEDIGEVGVSIYSVDEFELANENPDIDLLQLPYNILDPRFNSDYLSRTLDPAKKVFARSIFLQGVLLRPASGLPSAVSHLREFKNSLEEVTRETGLDDLDIALGFAMGNQALTGIIVGTSSLKELREIASRKSSLSGKDLSSVFDFDNVPTWDAVDPRRWSH